MVRSRFPRVAFALALGLTSGCLCLRSHPLFQKHASSTPECECATSPGAAGMVGPEGPILDSGAPALPPITPEAGGIPQLSTPPRLVPQPQTQQAQPAPYFPR